MKTICLLLLCMGLPTFAGSDATTMSLENRAEAYLYAQSPYANQADLQFDVIDRIDDELGQTHLRFRAQLDGLPVYGEHLIVHTWAGTGEIIGSEGSLLLTNLDHNLKTTVDPLKALAKQAELPSFELTRDPELVYVVDEKHTPMLAQMLEVTYEDSEGPNRDLVFVDARSGELLATHPQIKAARNRMTYDLSGGGLVRSEGDPDTGDAAVDNAHNHAGNFYDYFYTAFGRDSMDGMGMTINSYVHYSINYNNAFWSGSGLYIGDGDGWIFDGLACLDIVVHELTHGVTQYTADLVYANESGALNESTSDIMAAAVEAALGGNFTDIWYIGEDCFTPGTPGDAVRYMNDPALDGFSTDYYPDRYVGSADNGGVHINSGIANLMFYLLSAGGTHPRGKTTIVVTGIGTWDAAQIWYRALTVYMTPSTNFNGARSATLAAAADLYGASSQQYRQTCRAWAAVGLGYCKTLPVPFPTKP